MTNKKKEATEKNIKESTQSVIKLFWLIWGTRNIENKSN